MIHFIVNKKSKSGNGAKIWKVLQAYLRTEKIQYRQWTTDYPGHGTKIARKICASLQEEVTLIVVGGDGTANEVINGITHFEKVRFGIIPTGSGNDLARGLGISGSPLTNLKRMLKSKEDKKIDLGKVTWMNQDEKSESRFYIISSGIGLDALVCKKAMTSPIKKYLNRLHLGKLTYLVLTVISLFTMETANALIAVDGVSKRYKKLIFLAAMNFSAEGGGVPMAPAADAADGVLSLCFVSGLNKLRAFCALPFLVAAKHENINGVNLVDCKEVHLKLDTPFVLHTDGEYCGEVADVTFSCMPELLRIIL